MPRIAHLSDIHFGGENVAAVAAAREWLVSNPVDLTVISGDLTRFGQRPEFDQAKAFVDSLSGPRLLTPGNHDTPWAGIWQRIIGPFEDYKQHFGAISGAQWAGPGMALACVNTARGMQVRLNWSKGEIGAGQASAALATLAARPAGALGVIVCHHPLVEMAGGPMTARVRGGQKAARRFAEGGVDLILTGHIHAPFAMAFPYGDGKTYAIGAGTLSVRERGAPPGFNLIEFDEAKIEVTSLAWSGSHFAEWRRWTFRPAALADFRAGCELADGHGQPPWIANRENARAHSRGNRRDRPLANQGREPIGDLQHGDLRRLGRLALAALGHRPGQEGRAAQGQGQEREEHSPSARSPKPAREEGV